MIKYIIGKESDSLGIKISYGEYVTIEDAANARAYAKVIHGLELNIYKLTIKKELMK